MISHDLASISVMDVFENTTGPDAVSVLASHWHVASTIANGATAADWHGDAVYSMARAMIERSGIERAAAELAAERANKGISLAEGLVDLRVLFEVARAGEPPFDVGATFAEQWSETMMTALVMRTCIDAITGLATPEFLNVRLREVYAENPAAASDLRCFVVVDGDTLMMNGWQRLLRTSLISDVLMGTFNRGQTNAVLPSGRFVSLVARNDELDSLFSLLRHSLTRQVAAFESPPVRAWIEPLPSSALGAQRLLLDL